MEGFNVRIEGGVCGDVGAPVGMNVVGSFAKGSGERLFSKADDFEFTGKEGFHLYSVLSVPRAARAGRIMLIDVMRFAGVGILSIHIYAHDLINLFKGRIGVALFWLNICLAFFCDVRRCGSGVAPRWGGP